MKLTSEAVLHTAAPDSSYADRLERQEAILRVAHGLFARAHEATADPSKWTAETAVGAAKDVLEGARIIIENRPSSAADLKWPVFFAQLQAVDNPSTTSETMRRLLRTETDAAEWVALDVWTNATTSRMISQGGNAMPESREPTQQALYEMNREFFDVHRAAFLIEKLTGQRPSRAEIQAEINARKVHGGRS